MPKETKTVGAPKVNFYRTEEGAIVCQTEIGPEPPEWILIHPYSHVEHWKGAYDFFEQEGIRCVENFERYKTDICVDYRHETHYGFGLEQAAGWVKELKNRGVDGLWGKVEWTHDGEEKLRTKTFRFISPVVDPSVKDPYTGAEIGWTLTSAALTNRPFLLGMPALVNHQEKPHKKEVHMLEKLKKLFHLEAEATEEEVVEAVEAKVNAAPAANEIIAGMVLTELGLPAGSTPEQVTAKINEMRKPKEGPAEDPVIARISTLEQTQRIQERDRLVDQAISSGKLFPSERDTAAVLALKDPDLFRKMMDARPSHQLTTALPVGKGNEGGFLVDDDQARINQNLSITPELWDKYYGPKGVMTLKEMSAPLA